MPILAAELFDKADFYRKQFDTAKPFRHVLIPQFFDPAMAEAILAEFPVPRESEMINEFGIKNRKFACRDVRSIGPTYCLIDDYISSPEFSNLMERITGIHALLYDPTIRALAPMKICRVREWTRTLILTCTRRPGTIVASTQSFI